MKKTILLALLAIVGILGAGQMVLADSPTLSISPESANSTVGVPFNVSVKINSANNKVCAVRGTVIFNGLACQNINVAGGLIALTAPTCASPSFIIGIPKCTTTSQDILSMSVKGSRAGLSTLAFDGVRIMGAGTGVSSVWYGGAYNIAATAQTTTSTTTTTTTQQPAEQVVRPTQQTTQTEVTTPAQQTAPVNNIPTGVAAAGLMNSGASQWFNWILIIAIICVVIYAIYYFATRKKK